MHRYLSALALLTCFVLVATPAAATLTEYKFEVSTGTAESMSNANTLWSGFPGSRGAFDWSTAGVDLPFTFTFDGVPYTRVSISPNGVMSLGDIDVPPNPDNTLQYAWSYPIIAPFWDDMTLTGGSTRRCSGKTPRVRWAINGTAPNRVFVCEWEDVEVTWGVANYSTWQARLFEGSNIIEFYYDDMTATSCPWGWTAWTSGTIGIASNSGDFMSVIPDYGSAYVERSYSYDWVDIGWGPFIIPQGTLYRFAPCNISFTGNVAQGGTANMSAGDTLLMNVGIQRWDTEVFEPFSIDNIMGGCGPRNYSMSISGDAAGDYWISGDAGYLNNGESATPQIWVTPSGGGPRYATLTVTDDNLLSRDFVLAVTGTTRMEWIPDLAEGGTPDLSDGDTLLKSIMVPRFSMGEFEPLTVRNFSTKVEAPPAEIMVSIDSAGLPSTQYEIIGPTTASLYAGETFTPVIRFSPTGLFSQPATLTVTADDEVRVYTLYAISGHPAIVMRVNGEIADPETPALNLIETCVGIRDNVFPVHLQNTGALPLVISDIDVFLTDTTYQQGTPMLPLLRDAQDRPVPMIDYWLSETPGGPSVEFPITVEGFTTGQYFLTYVGSQPGKRFGRMFMRTNAENIFGQDTTAFDGIETYPTMTQGLLVTDVTGRAIGAQLAANPTGLKIESVVFPHTSVGDTSYMSFAIANSGACDLKINRQKLRIYSGDVNEFRIVETLHDSLLVGEEYVLAPGVIDSMTVRFIPSRAGTRMATLWIQTNDSMLLRPGIAERGAFYLDLHGRGRAGLDGSDITLDPVVIGGSVDGVATLENTLTVPVGIDRIFFDGGDAAEFSPVNWPATPHAVLPGAKLQLGVRFTPAAGSQAGVRRTTIALITGSGDTVRVGVRAEAGTQTLVVSPTSMFDDVSILVGQVRRQSLMISNTGTLPVRIVKTEITGPDSLSYRLGQLPRIDLEPGQTDYLDVTFVPTASGQTSAQIEVTASNGQVYTVMLGGTALKARHDPTDPARTHAPDGDGKLQRQEDADGLAAPVVRPSLR